jgi:hypothetical protein
MSVATPGRDVANVADESRKLDAGDQRNPGKAALPEAHEALAGR